jgi:hypothetical protein
MLLWFQLDLKSVVFGFAMAWLTMGVAGLMWGYVEANRKDADKE